MARNTPRGFVPTRHLTGGSFTTGPRRQTGGSNAAEIRQNDPVFLDSNGNIQRYVSEASAAAPPALGVVAAVYDSNRRPKTHSLPSAAPVIAASTEGFVEVWEDPFIVFVCNATTSLGQSEVGKFAEVNYTANGTAAGISGAVLGTSVSASSIGHVLKIVGVHPNDGDYITPVAGTANNDAEVIFVQHMWTNPIRRDTVEVL